MADLSEYALSKEIKEALAALGYEQATPVQEQIIPLMLAGKDVIGKSQTGSGKTAAFGIPVCNQIQWEENAPQALVLEPTRELALQVRDELFKIGRKKRIKIPVLFGGMPIDKEIISIKQKSHIVVGTPGRIMDHIRRKTLTLSALQTVVIDEADLMLDMGFLDEVTDILQAVQQNVGRMNMALFSATFDERIITLSKQYMPEAVEVIIESKTKTVHSVEQYVYEVENEDKFSLLLAVLEQENPDECMVFCETREMVNTLYQKLRRKKIRCGMLHGGMEQRDRLYSINDFRQGKFHIFITTDVAARGIDFPDISHVINYDLPTKRENYIHRVGRTARNGRTGTAISFVQETEEKVRREIEEYSQVSMVIKDASLLEQENKAAFLKRQKEKVVLKQEKGADLEKTITKISIGGGKKSKLRPGDVVGAVCAIDGVCAEDIGIIDVRDSITYLEILNEKGDQVVEELQNKPIKGKLRKVQIRSR